ncbi:putative ring-h2 finger protein atl21a [Quercus suber]|uniref:RING-type E3 ubiquitin transferase n=1 Tax=Quercus suber TaxID=58331 RepID=A0AAW0LD30_QUESU
MVGNLRIVIPTLLLFVLFIVDLGEGHNWCPEPERCGDHGPDIRFPFRLSKERQPDQHGGFDLYCNDKDDTVLELSTSVKAFVKHIDYKSQSIIVTDSDNCFQRKIQELSLSSTPFQFTNLLYSYSLFSCTPDTKYNSYHQIPCLSSSRHTVYAFPSDDDIDDLPILSCTKMYSVSSVPDDIWENPLLVLTWSCGPGEVKGKNCRLEENSTDLKTGCKDKVYKSSATWHPVDRPSMKVVVQMLEGEGDKLTMPPNPFASTGPTRINVSMPARRLTKS